MAEEEVAEILSRLTSGIRTGTQSRSLHLNTAPGQQLQKLFRDLLQHGESSTLVVYGPPASGKTSFVEAAIQRMTDEANDSSSPRPTLVRLNGMIHPDLKSCMETICFTLDLQSELLNFVTNGTFFEERLMDVLVFLRNSLVSASETNPIIFILDKIELFCEHPGQALLYNLFDIVQTKTSPVCVIGVTSGQDILELFEKRVKSRFSHRILHLESLSFDQFEEAATKMLSLEGNSKWQAQIKELFSQNIVKQVLSSLHIIDPNIGVLNNFLYAVLLSCDSDKELSSAMFEDTFEVMFSDSVINQALDLTISELFMLKAIQKFTHNRNPAFNFDCLFAMVGRPSILENLKVNKTDLLSSMQTLERSSMITPLDKKGDKAQVYYKSELLSHQYENIFKKYPNVPTVFQTI